MVRTRVVATAGAVPGVVAEIGLPAVLRSGDDETVVRSGAALAEWARRHEHRSGPFAAGEFVPGPEVVVTTLTHDGMHRVVGVTAQRAVAHGVRYLFPATVGEAEAREVRATVTAMLDLVGYEFGPAETSVVLSGRGPRIVRARPGFGSRGIARLIEVTTGFDVQTELCRALAGVPVRPPAAEVVRGRGVPPPAEHRSARAGRGGDARDRRRASRRCPPPDTDLRRYRGSRPLCPEYRGGGGERYRGRTESGTGAVIVILVDGS